MNNRILENFIKKTYLDLERNVLILIAIPLPFFAIAYLFNQNGTVSLDVPQLPLFLNTFGLAFVYALLAFHYFIFHNTIKKIITGNYELSEKVNLYAGATMTRFWILFASGILCSLGLLFFEDPGFTIAFAITLVFSSLGKPSPDRIVRLLRLKGEEKEEIERLKIRG